MSLKSFIFGLIAFNTRFKVNPKQCDIELDLNNRRLNSVNKPDMTLETAVGSTGGHDKSSSNYHLGVEVEAFGVFTFTAIGLIHDDLALLAHTILKAMAIPGRGHT